jgi:hypothetical protein
VYTICVNIGLLDIHADSDDINYIDVNNGAYAPDIDVDDEEAKESNVGDSKYKDDQASLGDKEGVAKSAFVACSSKYSDDKVMQGNIWSVQRRPEPPIPMLFPSHFSSPQRFLFSLA